MFKNIRVFIRLVYLLFAATVFKKSAGVFHKSCGLCDGVMHTRLSSLDDNNGNYEAKFQCQRCGAVGSVKEKWEIEKDVAFKK